MGVVEDGSSPMTRSMVRMRSMRCGKDVGRSARRIEVTPTGSANDDDDLPDGEEVVVGSTPNDNSTSTEGSHCNTSTGSHTPPHAPLAAPKADVNLFIVLVIVKSKAASTAKSESEVIVASIWGVETDLARPLSRFS